MVLFFFSCAIHFSNLCVNLVCNRILKLSNREKPEAMRSSLDLIFHDLVDCISIDAIMVNSYSFVSIFLDEVNVFIDLIPSALFVLIGYQMMYSLAGLFSIMLIYIFQKGYIFEDYTDQFVCNCVRAIGLVASLLTVGVGLLFGRYPYFPIAYPELLNKNNSILQFEPLLPTENPMFILFSWVNGLLLALILKEKIKLEFERSQYVKAFILFLAWGIGYFTFELTVLRYQVRFHCED